jgi:hypothetical protein
MARLLAEQRSLKIEMKRFLREVHQYKPHLLKGQILVGDLDAKVAVTIQNKKLRKHRKEVK